MEGARPGEANTDWGAVDPTQNNVQGYFNLLPGEKFLDAQESPRNCNWFLITLGCRRGLTFLEQQTEVDGKRLGIRGHSMGGNLTMYVAGSDTRVKVASPSVGGSGYRTYARYGLPPQIRKVKERRELMLLPTPAGNRFQNQKSLPCCSLRPPRAHHFPSPRSPTTVQ